MAIETLRPNAAGDECNILSQSGCSACPNHYECVDEAVADDATTCLTMSGTPDLDFRDLYNIADSGVGAGTISKITVYFKWRRTQTGSANIHAHAAIKTGGTAYDGAEKTQVGEGWTDWAYSSEEWADNPGGGAWSWADINALQIGVRLTILVATGRLDCTQVYVEVDYIAGVAQAVGGASMAIAGTLDRLIKLGVGAGSVAIAGALGRLIKLGTGAGSIAIAGALGLVTKIVAGGGSISITGSLGRKIKLAVGSGSIAIAGAFTFTSDRILEIFAQLFKTDLTIESTLSTDLTIKSTISTDLTIESTLKGG